MKSGIWGRAMTRIEYDAMGKPVNVPGLEA